MRTPFWIRAALCRRQVPWLALALLLLVVCAMTHGSPARADEPPIQPLFMTGSSTQPLGGAYLSAAGAFVYWDRPEAYPGPSWSLLLGQSGGPTNAGWPVMPGRVPTLSRQAADLSVRLATLKKACRASGRLFPTSFRVRLEHDGYASRTIEVPASLFTPGRHTWPARGFEKLTPVAHTVVFHSSPEGAAVHLQTLQGPFLARTGERATLLMPLFLGADDRYADRTLVYVLEGYTTRQEIVRPAEILQGGQWPPDGLVVLQPSSRWVAARDEVRRYGWGLATVTLLATVGIWWRRRRSARVGQKPSSTVRFRPPGAPTSVLSPARTAAVGTVEYRPGEDEMASVSPDAPRAGRWLLGEPLGKGGSATVYRGIPVDGDGDAVAIKILETDAAEAVPQRARFEREVVISCRLSHPNIIRIIDWGPYQDSLFLAMELLEGPSLRRVIAGGGLAPDRFFELFRALLEATRYAHAQGVVHRDLKPENVLTTARGVAKIVDFGIARGSQFATVTTTGHAMGTLAYLPPERFVAAMNDDPRSDQYALGIMGYEMLAGRRPYPDSQLPEVLLGVLSTPPPDLKGLRPDIPAAVVDVLMRLMALDPEERFPSADDALQALDGARASDACDRT